MKVGGEGGDRMAERIAIAIPLVEPLSDPPEREYVISYCL